MKRWYMGIGDELDRPQYFFGAILTLFFFMVFAIVVGFARKISPSNPDLTAMATLWGSLIVFGLFAFILIALSGRRKTQWRGPKYPL
jgi:uncharacterized BrkB/YihY/UPF0761 family membrane protein